MIFNQSGGTSLNFKVVKNPQPANPSENTIWVNTDQKITGRYFQPTQPEDMAEGEVWISTGTASPVAFNAAKKGVLMVYPLAAKQMTGGTLVSVTAQSYQNGKWVDWIRWLYNDGNSFEDLTGGFTAVKMGYSSSASSSAVPSVTQDNDGMTIRHTSTGTVGGAVHTANKIDLSDFDTLYFDGIITANDGYAQRCNLSIWSQIGSYRDTNRVAYIDADNNDGVRTLDVSKLDGEYYIGFFIYNNSSDSPAASIKMRKMWLA